MGIRLASRAYIRAIQMSPGIYNVGSSNMNYSKMYIVNEIRKRIEFEIIEAKIEDKDRRDYIIDFTKIEDQCFYPMRTIGGGIDELIDLYQWYKPNTPYAKI